MQYETCQTQPVFLPLSVFFTDNLHFYYVRLLEKNPTSAEAANLRVVELTDFLAVIVYGRYFFTSAQAIQKIN
jgi:hypothetical protein